MLFLDKLRGFGFSPIWKRFSVPVLCSLISYGMFVFNLFEFEERKAFLFSGFLPFFFFLTYCSFTAARMAREAYSWNGWQEIVAGLSLLSCGFGLSLAYPVAQTFLLEGLVFLLLLMMSPFLLHKGDDLSFWIFQKKLWGGAFLVASSAVLLLLGAFVALLSIDYLFGDLPHSFVTNGLSTIAILYVPLMLLTRIPCASERSEENETLGSSSGLLFFLNWILAPLGFFYFLILYVYGLMILIQWELPKGNLSAMITGFGLIGICVFLIGWGLREKSNRLVQFLYKHFFSLLIFPSVLLFVAVGYRIWEYGLTEDRYLIVLLAVWFGFLSLLYTLRPTTPLRTIFLSLLGLLVLASFGPWGAVSLSERSQMARLVGILERNAMLVEGIAIPAESPVSFKDQEAVFSIVRYFFEKKRQELLVSMIPAIAADPKLSARQVLDSLNIGSVDAHAGKRPGYAQDGSGNVEEEPYNILEVSLPEVSGGSFANNSYVVSGYDFFFPTISLYQSETEEEKPYNLVEGIPEAESKGYALLLSGDRLFFVMGEKRGPILTAQDLVAMRDRRRRSDNLSVRTIKFSMNGASGRLILRSATIRDYGQGKYQIERLYCSLLVRK